MQGWSEGAIDECSNGGMMISREKYRNSYRKLLWCHLFHHTIK